MGDWIEHEVGTRGPRYLDFGSKRMVLTEGF